MCGAPLLRDIAAMIARGGPSHASGEALRAQARQMCHGWPRVRDGTLAPTTVASSRWPVRREVERWLEAGQPCGVPKTAGPCRELRKRHQAWWTFVRHPEVEPTNHAAERAIRPGVLWRKSSFGTQSPEGSRVVETMLTAVATLKQQHRNILDDVIAACEAALRNQPAPSLLPTPELLDQLVRPAAYLDHPGEPLQKNLPRPQTESSLAAFKSHPGSGRGGQGAQAGSGVQGTAVGRGTHP